MSKKYKNFVKDGILLLGTVILALVLGNQAPGWYKAWQGPLKKGDYSYHVNALPHQITLYGTSTCEHCKAARKFLQSAGIQYNDLIIDQSKSAADAFKELHQEAVPVILSNNRMFVGFNTKAYEEMIKLVKAAQP